MLSGLALFVTAKGFPRRTSSGYDSALSWFVVAFAS
jgi:hypothetical protein